MKKPSSGFLDIDFRDSVVYKRLKDGKWEKMTRTRRPELQALLELMKKEIGRPCAAFTPNCCVCEAWLSFARLDQMFEE